MPREHRLAGHARLELSDLAGERVVGSPSDCSPWGLDLRGLCSRAQVEPAFESCYWTVDFGSLQAIVATGRGITLVPELALTAVQATKRWGLRPIRSPSPRAACALKVSLTAGDDRRAGLTISGSQHEWIPSDRSA
jgi:DNA-binding transcriptional LysR family regulator